MKPPLRTWQATAEDADPVGCSRPNLLLQLCITLALAGHLVSPPVSSADDVIPPFLAEGRLSTRSFRIERTNLNYKSDADVFFLYSNGWWQVEVKYLNPAPETPRIQNCMRIPDGTRSFTLFETSTNTGATSASAWPTAFPQLGKTELLVPWLSLCPHPQLPLIDGNRMRRFLNLPIWRPDLFNHPQNEGFYDVKYLIPGNAFLSELAVTNNGFSIGLTVVASGGVEGEVSRLPAPFENGFTELEFRIMETTNVNGLTFPLRTVYRRFAPNWGGKSRDDVRVLLLSELVVSRISLSEKDLTRRGSAPSSLRAFDARPPNLPKNTTVDYEVHDDQWKPLYDPELALRVRRAREAREAANRETENSP